jgi:putative membrane protein
MNVKSLIKQWHFDPLIMILIIGIIYLYYLVTRFKKVKKALCFSLALGLLLLSECSPLHQLGMRYFSAHMISHIVELLVCGPLLVISLTPQTISPLHNFLSTISSLLFKHSWIAWFSGIGIMWFWHIPTIFNGAMDAMHHSLSLIPVLQAGSMVLAGLRKLIFLKNTPASS